MKKKSITIFSTSRSDFNILSCLIDKIQNKKNFRYNLILGGDHQIHKNKLNYIKKDYKIYSYLNFYNSKKYNYKNFCKSMSNLNLKLKKIFLSLKSDFILILGDRSELLPIVHHALMTKKKIIHIGGGENTYGAIDNEIRNMISQVAYMHFTMHKSYKLNLAKSVKEKSKIFNVGYLGSDNLSKIKKQKNKSLIYKKFNLKDNKLILFTYHPSVDEINKKKIIELKKILLFLLNKKYHVIATFPGMEFQNQLIKSLLFELKNNKNFQIYPNLGTDYFNLMKFSKCIVGNSSSGLIEAPFFKIPTINIGDRQNGRIKHKSVLDTKLDFSDFKKKFIQVNSKSFISNLKKMKYMFGNKDVSGKILKYINNEK